MYKLIDGKVISKQIKDELKEKVAGLKAEGVEICLAVIQVGNDPASSVYVGNKKKACEYIGMRILQKQHFQRERQQAQNRKMLHHQVQSQMMVQYRRIHVNHRLETKTEPSLDKREARTSITKRSRQIRMFYMEEILTRNLCL